MKKIITTLRRELKQNSNAKIRQSGQRFFKEPVKLYGLKTAMVSQLAKKYFQEIKNYPKKDIWALNEELWQSGYLEESFIACAWSYALRKNYEPPDFKLFTKWINNYINNWASCDTFCNHTVGAIVETFPQFIFELKKWTHSPNRWVRRAAAVSLIVPAKKGLFLKEALTIADLLLLDPEDLVQKGYGWLLKVASQPHQAKVFAYVIKNKNQMPRTALRYAIEKMPRSLKLRAMER